MTLERWLVSDKCLIKAEVVEFNCFQLGADTFAGDGIYSAYFRHFIEKGRYGVTVRVEGGNATVVSQTRILGED